PSCNRFCLSSSILLDGPDRRLDRGHIAVTLRDTAVPLGLCCRHLLLSFLKDSLSLLQSCTGKSQGFRSRLVAIPRPDHSEVDRAQHESDSQRYEAARQKHNSACDEGRGG